MARTAKLPVPDVTEGYPPEAEGMRAPTKPLPVGAVTEGYPAEAQGLRPVKALPAGAATEVFTDGSNLRTPNRAAFHGDGRYGAPPNPTAAPAAPVAPEAPTGASPKGTIGRIFKTTANVAGSGLRTVGGLGAALVPAAIGVSANRAIATGLADNTVSGPVPAPDPTADRSQGAAAIPTAAEMGLKNPVAPPQQPGNFFRDSDVGRNVGNAINASAGITGPASAALLSGAERLFGPTVARGAGMAQAAVQAAAADNAMGTAPSASIAGPPITPPGPAPSAVAPAADPAAGPQDAQGLRPEDPNRRPAIATFDEMLGAGRALDAYGPGAHTPDGRGGGAGIIDTSNVGANSAHNQNFAADVMSGKVDQALRLGGIHGPQQAQAIAAAYQNRAGNSSAERIANIREMGETARALAGNNAQKSIHDAANQVTLRGQDQILAGHRMANDVAVAQARRDQGNKDRQFALDEDKYGTEKAKMLFDQRETASKNLPAEIAGMLPTKDGKPDLDNAARHAAGMTQVVADMMQNPNTPAATKAALQRQGVGALGTDDKSRILASLQLQDVVNATATNGLTPWGTRPIEGPPPMALRRLPNGDYQTNRVGMRGETEVIPRRYIEQEGSTLGFGGRATNRFKSLVEN